MSPEAFGSTMTTTGPPDEQAAEALRTAMAEHHARYPTAEALTAHILGAPSPDDTDAA